MNAAQQWLLDYFQAWADDAGETLKQMLNEGLPDIDEIDLRECLLSDPCEGGLDALLDAWPTMPRLIAKYVKDYDKERS